MRLDLFTTHSENPEQQIQQNNTAAKQIRSTIMKIEYLCYTPKISEFSKYKIIPKNNMENILYYLYYLIIESIQCIVVTFKKKILYNDK